MFPFDSSKILKNLWSRWKQKIFGFLKFSGESRWNIRKKRVRGGPKKGPYFVFHPKVVFYNFFPYFSGGVDSRPGRFFWHQYGSKWTVCYAGVDKNHRGVLWRKISSSDTAAIQERFWQEQCTWWKDNSTFGGQISKDRKCGKGRDCSSFGIMPENI